MATVQPVGPQDSRVSLAHVAALLALALLIAGYVLTRYSGQWGETDTSEMLLVLRPIVDSGDLVPESPDLLYPNGYGYQAVVGVLSNFGGLDLLHLTLIGAVILWAWTVVPGWLLYRELTGSARGATLASVILLVEPDYLFALMRGTHEKFTRGLMLLAIFLLVCAVRSRHRPTRVAGFTIAFYLVAYALFAFNTLLATSFLASLLLAVGITWMARGGFIRDRRIGSTIPNRMTYAVGAFLVAGYLLLFYGYPPAQQDLRVIQEMHEKVSAIVFGVQTPTSDVPERTLFNPYEAVNLGWLSPPVYALVSSGTWLLLALSGGVWMFRTFQFVRRNAMPRDHELFLWALYAAFAAQFAGSIVVDLSGAIAGNLQHRMLPNLIVLAAPMVASVLVGNRVRSVLQRRFAMAGVGALIAVLAVFSMLKVTNEPLLSNKWQFYSAGEAVALDWAEANMIQRVVWWSFDERLSAAMNVRREGAPRKLRSDKGEGLARDVLVSDVNAGQSERLGMPIPVDADAHITYDNGMSQIHHARPKTGFQR